MPVGAAPRPRPTARPTDPCRSAPVGARPSARPAPRPRPTPRNNRFSGHSCAVISHRVRQDHLMKGHRQLRKGRHSLAHQVYHISSSTHCKKRFLADLECGRIVVRSMKREQDAGHTETLAFVVMPDHFHWLLSLSGTRPLSVSVNTVKSYAARRINCLLNRHGQIWQRGFFDRAIRRDEDLVRVARYIVANPVRAEIVESIRDYPLWDAIWM